MMTGTTPNCWSRSKASCPTTPKAAATPVSSRGATVNVLTGFSQGCANQRPQRRHPQRTANRQIPCIARSLTYGLIVTRLADRRETAPESVRRPGRRRRRFR
jgi:hypothetical protein